MGVTVLSLFSGVGGMDRAFNADTVAHVEIDPFAQRVLRRHWPDVPVLGDVRTVRGEDYRGVDLVVGGPPCQGASQAGLQRGEADERWMWPEAIRVVREAQPGGFWFENVPGLVSLNGGRSFATILTALSALGYFIRWDHCTAAEVGRPHLRDRVWLMGTREPKPRGWCSVPIDQVRKWPRAGWAFEGRTGEDVARWPKRDVWPLVCPDVCPPPAHMLWPTPSGGCFNEAEDVEAWADRRARVKESAGNGNGFGMPLGVASRLWPTAGVTLTDATTLYPTPNASDSEMVKFHTGKNPSLAMAAGQWDGVRLTDGRLSPAWVESLLMGWPLGWTEPDGDSLAHVPAPPRDEEITSRLVYAPPRSEMTADDRLRLRDRRNRLRCTGNGVVTETAALVYAGLTLSASHSPA